MRTWAEIPCKIWAEQNSVPLSLGETANNPGIVEVKADRPLELSSQPGQFGGWGSLKDAVPQNEVDSIWE